MVTAMAAYSSLVTAAAHSTPVHSGGREEPAARRHGWMDGWTQVSQRRSVSLGSYLDRRGLGRLYPCSSCMHVEYIWADQRIKVKKDLAIFAHSFIDSEFRSVCYH